MLSIPITPFSLICTISSEQSVTLDSFQNHPRSYQPGSSWLPGSTPSLLQEAFRAAPPLAGRADVAVCCSVLQGVAVCCRVLQYVQGAVAVECSFCWCASSFPAPSCKLQCVTVCCALCRLSLEHLFASPRPPVICIHCKRLELGLGGVGARAYSLLPMPPVSICVGVWVL